MKIALIAHEKKKDEIIELATNASSATIMLESLKNGTFPTVE